MARFDDSTQHTWHSGIHASSNVRNRLFGYEPADVLIDANLRRLEPVALADLFADAGQRMRHGAFRAHLLLGCSISMRGKCSGIALARNRRIDQHPLTHQRSQSVPARRHVDRFPVQAHLHIARGAHHAASPDIKAVIHETSGKLAHSIVQPDGW